MRALQARLGAHDRARVANYLDDVREIERRIQRSEAQQRADVTMVKPLGIPDSFEAHMRADGRPDRGRDSRPSSPASSRS